MRIIAREFFLSSELYLEHRFGMKMRWKRVWRAVNNVQMIRIVLLALAMLFPAKAFAQGPDSLKNGYSEASKEKLSKLAETANQEVNLAGKRKHKAIFLPVEAGIPKQTSANGKTNNDNNKISSHTGDISLHDFKSGQRTAQQIYGQVIPPGYQFSDNVRSVVSSSPSVTVQHMSAFGGYTYNENATGAAPHERNMVGLWIDGVNAVDYAATWGINTACIDNAVNGPATLVGRRCIGWEADFEVNGASTISGASLIIQGVGTPKNANGVYVNRAQNSTAAWTNAFVSGNGAAHTAMIVGAETANGVDSGSQPIVFNYHDDKGVIRGLDISVHHAALTIRSNLTKTSLYFQPVTDAGIIGITGSDAYANLELKSGSAGEVKANGSPVLTRAKTHLEKTIFADLPVCDAASEGTIAYIKDAPQAVTSWHQPISSGGGHNQAFIACNGTGWFAFSY